ncbi:class I SAM-dependent methyltransferase [Flavihumibacter sp. CACIAM 22H1]|uniref:O-methyltransferase n=1 Tax=Flavihumibacter sp. CACIAM 22H1 TaxID=1812911 RepID=UPI0007A8EBF3|nr:class I SAM-dependent methyltransferase [Flavihumibacter sp. CACIAM 22H1]KYP15068.1 MAG: SAM-dependent methyltransferase [Flavihumibacter sp. CACIAM 22H1]
MKHKPYSHFRLAVKYLYYWITAANGKGHGIHSPFVFALIRDVLNDRGEYYAFSTIEALRLRLELDKSAIEVLDLGAGGAGTRQVPISTLTKRTSKSKKLGRLLFRLTNYFQPKTMVELGTSMGLSAAYLYAGNRTGNLITLEGAPAVAAQARENFRQLSFNDIRVVTGNFDHTLEPLLSELQQVDFAYVDGNHRYEPTLRYFDLLKAKRSNQSVLVFDDIHWSQEMEAAWEKIKQDPAVRCTIDLFFIGLVFFTDSFKHPQHFTIRF